MNSFIYIGVGIVLLLVVNALRRTPQKFKAPPRIQLFAATPVGHHAKDLTALKHELDACGLKRIGTYRIDPLNVMASAFSNPDEHIGCVMYHHPVVGCFV